MAHIPRIVISSVEEQDFNVNNNHNEESINSSFSNEINISNHNFQHFKNSKSHKNRKHKRSKNKMINIPKIIITSESDDEKDCTNNNDSFSSPSYTINSNPNLSEIIISSKENNDELQSNNETALTSHEFSDFDYAFDGSLTKAFEN